VANIRSTVWYVNYGNGTSTGYYAVSQWAVATYTVGQLVIPKTAPAVGNERVYVCTAPGLSVGEPSWTFTKGAKQTDSSTGLETFQECTGQPGVCGDATNTPIWTVSSTWTLGQVITNIAGTGWFICATAGTNAGGVGAQPAGLATPVLGVTTTDASTTWTCIATASAGGPSNAGGPYAKWNAPQARLANAVATNWGAIGDTYYVGDNHAETQSTAMTISVPSINVFTVPNYIFCIDHTAALPPTGSSLATTATVTTTGTSALILAGSFYNYGVSYFAGTGAGTSSLSCGGSAVGNSDHQFYEACSLNSLGTASVGGAGIFFQGTASVDRDISFTLKNVTVSFGNVAQGLKPIVGNIFWSNTAGAITGTPPTILFPTTSGATANVYLDGVDLSALTSGFTIFGAHGSIYSRALNCRLGASVTVATTPSSPGSRSDLIISDSGAHGYRQESYQFGGTLTTSTTVYNNASDGVTPISWQVVTNANNTRAFPFECFQIVQWAAAGTYAATLIQCTSATASLLTSDIWVDVEYLGNASFPIASLATTSPANLLTAGSSLAAGTWATGGLGNNYQLAVPSFTTNLAGYVRFTVKVAKPSLTINIDPAVTIA